MDWESVLRVAAAIIGSVGGAGVIIIGISKFLAERIAERLQANYQLEIDKKLEEHKADIEQRNHIRQANYDREVIVYQELCEKFNDLIEATFFLFPTGMTLDSQFENDDELLKECNERFHAASEKYRRADIALATKAPFIPKQLYVKFDELRNNAKIQVFEYNSLNPWKMRKDSTPELIKERRECNNRTRVLFEEWDLLIDELREYLRSLSEQKES